MKPSYKEYMSSHQDLNCNADDRIISASIGVISGLVDAIFCSTPGQGILGESTDSFANNIVYWVAKNNGYVQKKDGGNNYNGAKVFLEGKFKVNYDQTHKVRGVKLNTKNHHIKSLAHHPSPIGLVFSIIDQIKGTSTFIEAGGKIITIPSTSNIKGDLIAKIWAGTCNWFGHCISDYAGSSGSKTRGMGLPAPFFDLLLLIPNKEFGEICVETFKQGYDARHGLTMAIPVIINELLTSLAYILRQKYYYNKTLVESLKSYNKRTRSHLLLISTGAMCAVDLIDAFIIGGGPANWVGVFLRVNIVALMRLGILVYENMNFACKGMTNQELSEFRAVCRIEIEKIDKEISVLKEKSNEYFILEITKINKDFDRLSQLDISVEDTITINNSIVEGFGGKVYFKNKKDNDNFLENL